MIGGRAYALAGLRGRNHHRILLGAANPARRKVRRELRLLQIDGDAELQKFHHVLRRLRSSRVGQTPKLPLRASLSILI